MRKEAKGARRVDARAGLKAPDDKPRSPRPRSPDKKRDTWSDYQLAHACVELHSHLGRFVDRLRAAEEAAEKHDAARADPDPGRRWYELPPAAVLRHLWPAGAHGSAYWTDRPLLRAAEAHLSAQQKADARQSDAWQFGSYIAEHAWALVLGTANAEAVCAGVAASCDWRGVKARATANDVARVAKRGRADTRPIVRVQRVYAELAYGVPALPLPDTREPPRGPLRKLLLGIGARLGDRDCMRRLGVPIDDDAKSDRET